MTGGVNGGTMPDLSNKDVNSSLSLLLPATLSPSYLDGRVPRGRVQPLLKPAHLTDGVVVAHQGVLPPAVRDGVEITGGTETCSWQKCLRIKSKVTGPLTCCCPRKSTPQFYRPPASNMRTAPDDGVQTALDVRKAGRNGTCCSCVPC